MSIRHKLTEDDFAQPHLIISHARANAISPCAHCRQVTFLRLKIVQEALAQYMLKPMCPCLKFLIISVYSPRQISVQLPQEYLSR